MYILFVLFAYFFFSEGVNKNRKLVAFAERGDRPHVVVFDLELRRRRKVLRCAEFVSQEVISLAFSHDSKYLLAQGNLSMGIDNYFGFLS